MSDRYYARVSFPADAKKIPEIAAWLAKESPFDDPSVQINCETIDVEDSAAKYGDIEITDILDAHRVPYDHRREGEAPYGTAYVRWLTGPAAVAAKLTGAPLQTRYFSNDEVEAAQYEAERLLDLWNASGADAVLAELQRVKACIVPPVNELDWKLP